MHSTDNLDDGYIGSGTVLAKSIRKYGRENFVKEILEFHPDRESLRIREGEIVDEKFVIDKMCMNVKLGGERGNFGTTSPNRKSSPHSESHKANISESCKGKAGKYEKTEEHRQKLAEANTGKTQSEETRSKRAETSKQTWRERGGHTEESKKLMSENRKGKNAGAVPWNKGLSHTEESKKKNSESHKGKIVSEETRSKISAFWEKRRKEKQSQQNT